ncbi:hypothetical protein BQ8482_760003 [Mesorhizobium delmotii]|uniref:Uncharacterized protein n=1 Tax=Mesorhizobium delmotii TaxID=1631247 RepID=A0A2P9AVY6_9HYPH|nr:hypothetical protein BQ8482_760003 [Mesorhizobium delmotii]
MLAALRDRGYDVAAVGNVGGGMDAIQFDADGTITGATCWRAHRSPIGGGFARMGRGSGRTRGGAEPRSAVCLAF